MDLVEGFEKLAPFARRARIVLIGRSTLQRSKSQLAFVLITRDLSSNGVDEICREFSHYPIVQCLTTEDLQRMFEVHGVKTLGFAKGALAKSLYQSLKPFRINRPPTEASDIPRDNG